MAKISSSQIKIEFDNSGGSLVDMSAYIQEGSEVAVNGLFEESTSFGDSTRKQTPVVMTEVDDITLSFFYDDTATTGPDAIFNAIPATVGASSRTLKVTWGTKTTSVETFVKKYGRKPSRRGLTQGTVTLIATGAVTET